MTKKIIYAKARVKKELKLTEEQIIKKANDIFDFLKVIHPNATSDEKKKGAIEIRFLIRGEGMTSGSLYSYNTWSLGEKDLDKLFETLKKYNGYSVCTYYSIYTYDWHHEFEKLVKSDVGEVIGTEMVKPGKIRKDSAMYTEILLADFDDMDEAVFLEEKQRFIDLGIETTDVFTGHGYQSIIGLTEKSYDKEILKKFTNLLIQKGFQVDHSLVDPNRVARLTSTLNCKQFATDMPKHYNPIDPKGIETYIVTKTEKRYDLDFIMNQLESLDDSSIDFSDMDHLIPEGFDSREFEDTKVKEKVKRKESVGVSELKKDKDDKKEAIDEKIEIKSKEDIARLYKHFNLHSLPAAIQNILMGSPRDFRNDTLFFIVPYLKNSLGLSYKEALETMHIWGELCEPPYGDEKLDYDIGRFWLLNANSKAKYGKYTNEMVKMYGKLDFDTVIRNDDEIIINNDFFIDIKDYSHGAVKYYIALRYMQYYYKEEKKNNFTKEEIMDFWGWSLSTYKRYQSASTKRNLVSKGARLQERVKGQKNELEFYPNPFLSSSKGTHGFTKIHSSLIKNLLRESFSGDEPTLYLYFKYLTNNRGKECFTSQRELERRTGLKQSTISKMTDRLRDRRLMKKITIESEDGSVNTTYRLLD